MRDPFSWSFPIGRLFGITVRVHVTMPVVALGMFLMAYSNLPAGLWLDILIIEGLVFLSVLMHEFGHCFAGRYVGGEANEILLWPLGGLARVEVPHTPWANFVTTIWGPLVNLGLCLVSGLALALCFEQALAAPWNPFGVPPLFRGLPMRTWSGEEIPIANGLVLLLVRIFCINWGLFWFNILIAAYPMDGGRLLQEILWPRLGYHRATSIAVFVGFVYMFLMIVVSLWVQGVMLLLLAFFIYTYCKAEWIALETQHEEALFGYDFSQGYTSLEREEQSAPASRKQQPNFIQRWLQRRAARKQQQEQERTLAEERRMDELLEKIQRFGKESLTDEEHRFLLKVSDRYKKK